MKTVNETFVYLRELVKVDHECGTLDIHAVPAQRDTDLY